MDNGCTLLACSILFTRYDSCFTAFISLLTANIRQRLLYNVNFVEFSELNNKFYYPRYKLFDSDFKLTYTWYVGTIFVPALDTSKAFHKSQPCQTFH